jgi:DNA-directed RNA polymerase specialized sigma24 family protein
MRNDGENAAVERENAELADEEIVRQVLDGNTPVFELLMRRYNERIYRATRSIVRDEEEAEDVMQQVYVNAFAHLRQFTGAARFSTWLTRIAINESIAGWTGDLPLRHIRRRAVLDRFPSYARGYCAGGSDHRARSRAQGRCESLA